LSRRNSFLVSIAISAVFLQVVAVAPHASAGGLPVVSVSNAFAIEGDSGQVNATFTISLDRTTEEIVRVDLATNNLTATVADEDYLDVSTPDFEIQPNNLSTTYEANVKGDTNDENNETFEFEMSNPENAELDSDGGDVGIGTIRDDDPVSNHARAVSLRLRRHLKAKGQVTVDDSYNKCRNTVPLDIQRKKPSGWTTVKSITTQTDGEFTTNLPDKTGRYRAKATRKVSVAGGDTQVCASKTSSVKRHRHG
jgi:hypothetical protein